MQPVHVVSVKLVPSWFITNFWCFKDYFRYDYGYQVANISDEFIPSCLFSVPWWRFLGYFTKFGPCNRRYWRCKYWSHQGKAKSYIKLVISEVLSSHILGFGRFGQIILDVPRQNYGAQVRFLMLRLNWWCLPELNSWIGLLMIIWNAPINAKNYRRYFKSW